MEALSIPGLLFRPFRGKSDYSQIADVFTRSWTADGQEVLLSAEDAARLYSNTKNSDPYRDFLIVEVDGSNMGSSVHGARREMVGYGRANWEDVVNDETPETAGPVRTYLFKFYIVPEWRGQGIETAMLQYYEKHLREIAASQDFAGSRFLQTFVSDRHQTLTEILESNGYEAVRYEYDMVRPDLENVPELPLPDGVEVLPVQSEHLRAIWEAEMEAFRDHWGFSEAEEDDYRRWLEYPNFQPHLWQVAWDAHGGHVAGMIRNYISEEENLKYRRQRGYTEWISVRRPWRRRGLARALLARSLRMHKDLGMTQAALSVDSQNRTGALQLYESMGFRVITLVPTYRKVLTTNH